MEDSVAFVGLALIGVIVAFTPWLCSLSNRVEDMELRSDFVNTVKEDIRELTERRDREFKEIRAILDAQKRSADAGAKLAACTLAERIDALAARIDAVELAAGVRQKPKVMGRDAL